jgi:site-specific recombinase XerD
VLKALFQTFLQERRFLRNCAQTTIRSYRQAWDAFAPVLASVQNSDEIRAAVKTGVIQMMNEGRLQPSSINVYGMARTQA